MDQQASNSGWSSSLIERVLLARSGGGNRPPRSFIPSQHPLGVSLLIPDSHQGSSAPLPPTVSFYQSTGGKPVILFRIT